MADALTPPLGRTAPLKGTVGTASLPTLAGVIANIFSSCLDDARMLVLAAALALSAAVACTPFG